MRVSEKFLRPNNTLGGKSLADFMLQNTMNKLMLYRKIFGVERLEKICFETYDVDTELDEFFKRRREVDKSPVPSYCRGFFDDKSNLSCSCNHANAAYKSGWWYSAVCTNALPSISCCSAAVSCWHSSCNCWLWCSHSSHRRSCASIS